MHEVAAETTCWLLLLVCTVLASNKSSSCSSCRAFRFPFPAAGRLLKQKTKPLVALLGWFVRPSVLAQLAVLMMI
jgi:hypothetical protein